MHYSRRNLEVLVLLCDFGLPSVSTEGESALDRFHYRKPSGAPLLHSLR
jgi:hypothetical protein